MNLFNECTRFVWCGSKITYFSEGCTLLNDIFLRFFLYLSMELRFSLCFFIFVGEQSSLFIPKK